MSNRFYFSIKGKDYIKVEPSLSLKQKAEDLVEELEHKTRFHGWFSESDCNRYGIGIWGLNIKGEMDSLLKSIEDQKVKIYNSRQDKKAVLKEKKILSSIREKYEEKIELSSYFNHLTFRGYSNRVKNDFLICKTVFHKKKLVFNWPNYNRPLLSFLYKILSENSTEISDLRKIARSDEWQSYWSMNKKMFRAIESSDDQRTLVNYTNFYENIRKLDDCPPDSVIEDDDMLDGWMIERRRNLLKEKNKKDLLSSISPKVSSKGGELFIPVSQNGQVDKEKLREVNELNDQNSIMIKEERSAIIKKNNTAKDSQFKDVRQQMQRTQNEKFKESVK